MGQLGDRFLGDRAKPVKITLKWLWQDSFCRDMMV